MLWYGKAIKIAWRVSGASRIVSRGCRCGCGFPDGVAGVISGGDFGRSDLVGFGVGWAGFFCWFGLFLGEVSLHWPPCVLGS